VTKLITSRDTTLRTAQIGVSFCFVKYHISHVQPDGSKISRSVRYPPLLHLPPPEASSVPLLPCLRNPTIHIHHVFRNKTLRLGIEGWKLVFRLSAVSEVGGGILFRLLIRNSVWILVLAVEGEGPPRCDVCVRSLQQGLLGFVFYVCRVPLPHLCFCSIVIMGPFPSGELRSLLGFLSRLTELVEVTGSIMLRRRRKYGQSFFNVLIVYICCTLIVKFMLFCYGNHCVLFMCWPVLFTVIKHCYSG
jgi:hypothetical protein